MPGCTEDRRDVEDFPNALGRACYVLGLREVPFEDFDPLVEERLYVGAGADEGADAVADLAEAAHQVPAGKAGGSCDEDCP